MRKRSINKAASIKALLHDKAKSEGKPYNELLQYYGIERFLYRFSISKYVEKFVLKGALLFTAWDLVERRITRDIDFLAIFDNDLEGIETVIKEICRIEVDDGIVFNDDSVVGERIKEDADYEGVRMKFEGLIEKTKVLLQIDFGFGDIVHPNPQRIEYPAIIDLDKFRIRGYTAESVIAEKFEAMVKLGMFNSRMKDFYDIWLLSRKFVFEEKNIVEALRKTFENRKTNIPTGDKLFADEMYNENSDKQKMWKAFITKNEIENAPIKLPDVLRQIEQFLEIPIKSILNKEPGIKRWGGLKGGWG